MLYHQRYSTDFQKLSFCWKMWKIGIWAENRSFERSYFSFAMARWKLFSSGKIWNFPLSSCTLCQKKCYIPKVFNRFSKTFLLLKDVENRYLGKKFHERSYFSFAMARWKLFSGGKIWNFPLSSCTLCQKKCYITKGIQPIFKKSFECCWKMWKIGIWAEKFHERSYFSFAMARWKLCFKWKNLKFPYFQLYTLSAKMLYHQRYSTDFQNFPSARKMWNIGIWEENFMSAAILVSQWQGENFSAGRQIWNFPTFKLYTVLRKNAISPRVFNRFSKTFLLLKDVENRYLGRKFHERQLF